MARIFIELSCPSFQENNHRVEIQLYDFKLPKAAANLLYLVTGHEIPSDVLRKREQFLGAPLPPPLRGTNLLRISHDRKQIDIGGSPTASVFGGCYDDDVDLASVQSSLKNQMNINQHQQNGGAATLNSKNPFMTTNSSTNQQQQQQHQLSMFQHNVGTISVSNCGPNTNGSRYFISMDRRPDLDGLHQIVGFVAPHSMDVLKAIASQHRFNAKKGNAPDPAIIITDCGVIRAHDAWKQTALGVPQQQQQDQQSETAGKKKLLMQRGQDRGKRMEAVSDQVALAGGGASQSVEGAAELGELARRNAKRRRIENAAAGAGAWQEPEEVANASASATTGGALTTEHVQAEWNASGAVAREKQAQDQAAKQQRLLSRRERWAKDAGEKDKNAQTPLTERNIFAMAARTSQFEQDLKLVSSEHKVRVKKHQAKGRAGSRRY